MSKAVVLLLHFVFALVGAQDVDYLYGSNHYPVKEYTGGNSIYETSEVPRIVEFYSPHCPVCVAFQPEYMKLARDTRYKYQEVEFYAVSCDHHDDVCKKFGIEDYPIMFAFPAGMEGKRIQSEASTPDDLAKKLFLTSKVPAKKMGLRRRMDEDNANGDDDAAGGNDGGNGDDDEANNGNGDGNGDDDNASSGGGNGNDDQANNGNGDDDDTNNDGSGGNGDDDNTNNDGSGGNGDDDNTNNDGSGGNGDDDNTNNDGNGDDDQTNNGSGNGDDDNTNTGDGNGDDDEANGGNGDDDNQGTRSGPPPMGMNPRYHAQLDGTSMYQPPPGPAFPQRPMNGRRPGAGATRARTAYRDMDRFQEELKGHRQEYDKKRQGVGKMLRKDGRKDKHGKPIERMHPDAMTKTMKVHRPGTAEYNDRKEKVMKRLKKVKKDVPAVLTKEQLPYKKDVRKETFVKNQVEKVPIVKRMVKMTPEEELILDVSASLVAALETGTFVTIGDGELDREKKNALKDFLDLLNISLPPEWGIHKLIDDLRRRIAYIAQSRTNLKFVIDKHPLPRRGWSNSCTHGRSRSSGFACGLWKLFHVASVGVAEHRGGLNLIESGMVSATTKTFTPIDAADTIKGFIEHFFTCKSCREHFVQQYDDCENNRRCDRLTEELEDASIADWKELPVWLWEVHNEVSIHIIHQRIERENRMTLNGNAQVTRRATAKEEVSALWPNVENCVMCFEDDGTWDETEVFKFLERSYWPDSELDPKSDRLLTFEGERGLMSALFLWILVFMIVYVVYSTVKKNSSAINQSVVVARHMMQRSAGAAAPMKKDRTN